jgi:hypothetical protein
MEEYARARLRFLLRRRGVMGLLLLLRRRLLLGHLVRVM